MHVQILSDIHLEFESWHCENAADVIILAGDIGAGTQGIEWAAETFSPDTQVIYVAGNHEFYGHSLPDLYNTLREAASRHTHVNFLERESLDFKGIRFLGCTLWTDFAIHGDADASMDAARTLMNDYNYIDWNGQRMLEPEDVCSLHQESRVWLTEELARAAGEGLPVVVITHHCPAPQSIPARFLRHPLNGAFASDLTKLIQAHPPRLWVHGHTHDNFDYTIGTTRVVCNPIGYPEERTEESKTRGLVRLL